jgi:hypothetical protein
MRTSSLGLSATKSMCLGLGASALDQISKRPNLNIEKDRIESSKRSSWTKYRQYCLTSRDVWFRPKSIKSNKIEYLRSKRSTSILSKAEPTFSTQLFLKMINC